MNPKAKGEISEGIVLAHLLEFEHVVLVPFGNNQRYDYATDDGGKFTRIQVKTGHLANGCVTFNTASVNGFTGKSRDYRGQADDFMIYCPQLRKLYRIAVSACGTTRVHLRVDPPKGGTKSNIRWARDYECPTLGA